ncbi:hypothetical protein D3C80_1593730 [compost metagenome]
MGIRKQEVQSRNGELIKILEKLIRTNGRVHHCDDAGKDLWIALKALQGLLCLLEAGAPFTSQSMFVIDRLRPVQTQRNADISVRKNPQSFVSQQEPIGLKAHIDRDAAGLANQFCKRSQRRSA